MKPLNNVKTELQETNKAKSIADNKINEPNNITQAQMNYNQVQANQFIPYIGVNKNVSYMPVQKPM